MQQIPIAETLIYTRIKIYISTKMIGFCQQCAATAREEGVQMYDYENSPEHELIRRAKRGDAEAFSQLYAEIYKDLYKFALYVTQHPQDAEDAVSETIISAFENIRSLKKENSFKSWIFTILNHRCKKVIRNSHREFSISDQEETADPEPDYAQQHDVRSAFNSLDEEERMIVAFSVFGGYQSDEIAEMLDRNAATVRSRKSRALEKMRAILGRADG